MTVGNILKLVGGRYGALALKVLGFVTGALTLTPSDTADQALELIEKTYPEDAFETTLIRQADRTVLVLVSRDPEKPKVPTRTRA